MNLYNIVWKLQVLTDSIQRRQRNIYNIVTTYVAEVGTILSPKHGVVPIGHCRPGTDPTSTDQPSGTE
jgi:hypothetical protein